MNKNSRAPREPEQCYVAAETPSDRDRASALAHRWQLPLATVADPAGLRLRVGDHGVCLGDTRPGAPGAIHVDFRDATLCRRLRQAGSAREPLLRAIGARRGVRPDVVDATAGLGQDAAVMAAAGCRVRMVERAAALAALLDDGLRRAAPAPPVPGVPDALALVYADSTAFLAGLPASLQPDVVYLDPMYPPRGGGRSGRAMQHLQSLLGGDGDPAALLAAALRTARRRVVVKRQRRARPLAGPAPDFTTGGSSTRFDVYLLHR